MRKSVAVAGATFTIAAAPHDGGWRAEAIDGSGGRFGPAIVDRDPDRAIDRVARWLVWQRRHDELLRALQDAEQGYHRAIAAGAFAPPAAGASTAGLRADALRRLDEARRALDAARRRKPE